MRTSDRGAQRGFAYLFLLFVVFLLSVSALALGIAEHSAKVRADEAELLRLGAEFRRALVRYHRAAVPNVYPASLDDLLEDSRSGVVERHLRRIAIDPMTRTRDWGLVLEQGRIVGVHSLSERTPMKVAGFAEDEAEFENAQRYADWVFRVGIAPDAQDPARLERTAD